MLVQVARHFWPKDRELLGDQGDSEAFACHPLNGILARRFV